MLWVSPVSALRSLQKSVSENERLKRDLRVLGAELAGCEDRLRAAQALVSERQQARAADESSGGGGSSSCCGGGGTPLADDDDRDDDS